MAVVVSDTFDRGNGPMGVADTGQVWGVVQTPSSTWAISGNKARATAANLSIIALESGVSDCTVSADFDETSGENGIAWRIVDNDNHYMIFPRYNSVYKKVDGTYYSLSNILVGAVDPGTWSVVLAGNEAEVKLNGITQATVTDPFNAAVTKHGLMAHNTVETFNNFLVTIPDTIGSPGNTSAPILSGTAAVGSALSCTTGVWSNSPTSYARQWWRGGVAISGATAGSYTVVSVDQAATLTCVVTATNAVGSAAATSNGIMIPGTTITIAPNDANIKYSPYNWNVNASRALTPHPGAYFRVMIQGSPTAIAALFDVSALQGDWPQLWYRVDDGPWTKVTIAPSVSLTMPASTSAWTVHVVEIVVKGVMLGQDRWAEGHAVVQWTGLSTVPDTCSTRPVYRRPLDIAMYGDSITQGVLTIKGMGGTPEVDAHDAMQCWGWLLGEHIGAEVGVIAYAGQGWSVGVPSFPASWDKLTAAITRDLTTPAPDWVVIVHGQNDITGDVTATVTSTLNAILAAIPATTAIAVVRPITGTQAANIQAGIAACSAPNRVTWVDTTGWRVPADSSDGAHPWGYVHVGGLAPRLAQALAAATPSPPPGPGPPPLQGVAVWPITATVSVR